MIIQREWFEGTTVMVSFPSFESSTSAVLLLKENVLFLLIDYDALNGMEYKLEWASVCGTHFI